MDQENIGAIQETESSDDLRSQLQAAYSEAAAHEETPDESERLARARDDKGRFAKPEAAGNESAADAGATETPVADQPGETGNAEPHAAPTETVKAPDSWNAAAKAKFAELPADIQAEISRRETEIHKGFTKQDEDRTFGKQLRDVITPYMPVINSIGIAPHQAVQALLNADYILRTGSPEQKAQYFNQLAQQYGVPLDQVSTPVDQFVDPTIQALQQELQALKSQQQQVFMTQQQQEQARIQAQIDAFANDPQHVHYETVKAHMAALLQSGLAKDMADAYNQAVYANPTTRSALQAEQQAQAATKRQQEAQAKADAARRAGASVTGSPGSAVPPNANQELSLRDQLKAAMSKAGRI